MTEWQKYDLAGLRARVHELLERYQEAFVRYEAAVSHEEECRNRLSQALEEYTKQLKKEKDNVENIHGTHTR